MNEGRTIFAQLFDVFPKHEFNQCVSTYAGNRRVRGFSCYDQFLIMSFAQLTGRESLRDIVTCARALGSKLYHAGIRGKVSRSTLADANQQRDWRIYADFGQRLIKIARALYASDPFAVELENTTYALDSTTIDLCLSVFPWARFRKHKGAVKMHTLIDLRGNIPAVIRITHGKVHDVHMLDEVLFEAGAVYIMDRAYTDFKRLYRLHQAGSFFITRAKSNLDYRRIRSRKVDKATGVWFDQEIALNGVRTRRDFPDRLRRIGYRDPETGNRLVFITNNFLLDPLIIADLYRCRWEVEVFFKWIKQHLRIKAFFGTSPNAVKTQIWIAICVYVIVAILKKHLHLEASLYTILQILSVSLFEKTPILQALSIENSTNPVLHVANQLNLFDL